MCERGRGEGTQVTAVAQSSAGCGEHSGTLEKGQILCGVEFQLCGGRSTVVEKLANRGRWWHLHSTNEETEGHLLRLNRKEQAVPGLEPGSGQPHTSCFCCLLGLAL